MQIYGLCFVIENEVKPIPLQHVVVKANIVDMITEVTINQTYKNIEKDTIEALYKFPIYEAAAVCGFEAEIDGQRKVKGIVKEAKEAAKEYTDSIQQGHGAYLLESESEDIFQCSVGNIASGQTVVLKITYVTELKHDSETEKIRFVLPTHIAPRYVDYYLDLKVTCRMTSIIQNIESPSHKISTEMNIDENPKISKITLAEQITYLEKDFILVVKSKDLDQPRAFIEYNPETETNCVMLTLVPKFALNTTMAELVFVVDRSGSMSVEPMKKAAQALELLLRSLPEDCYFNVVSFGSRHDSLFPKSQLYSETSLSQAIELAQSMTSNYGGTEIFGVLKWVFENSRDDMPASVFLITDGQVYNVEQVVELIREKEEKKKDDLRLFSLGIGDSVSHNLVESVARAGKGYAQFVTNNERMDKKVIGMLKNSLKPPIKDYKITWTDVDFSESTEKEVTSMVEDKPIISLYSDKTEPPPSPPSNIFTDIKVQQAPYSIPPIYPGVRFVVYCILEKDIEPRQVITLDATSQDGPMKLDISLDPVTLQGLKIHRLAARKLIQDLDDGNSFLHKHPKNSGKHIPASLVKDHIVNLGKTFNLASKHTSFIAIDERNNEIVSESQTISQIRLVPVPFQLNSMRSATQKSRRRRSFVFKAMSEASVEADEACEFSAPMKRMSLRTSSRSLAKKSMKISISEADKRTIVVEHREPHTENLYEFLSLQSFDEIKGADDIEELEEILTTCIAIAYLEVVLFEKFKDEFEMCYEKAKNALKKMVGDENKEKIIIHKANEWIKNWVGEKKEKFMVDKARE
ncbi:9226_t:CDS:10 [Funneliformis caledonium]|uniref:9226_t:CDS:1 n=1 Tax=Funneliformis caledonium TaxID=1117310 RepID=A0A9N9B9H8_9GLOM|nr:9226_t:CDS:10 [Funneliformis caledonium]